MNLAVENLLSVSMSAVVSFFFTWLLIYLLAKVHKGREFHLIKRKPLIIPALVFILVVVFVPRQHIGPPPGLESNAIHLELQRNAYADFEAYDWTPYIPRARVDYSYHLQHAEIIECSLLVYENGNLVTNVTTSIYYSGNPNRLSSAHSTFDLNPGNYTLSFSQRVLNSDGAPTPFFRIVSASFYQLQDYEWIDVSLQWEQYLLVLFVSGFGLLLFGIYATDHSQDTPEEKERYDRKRRGEHNYPYSRAYRRAMQRQRK